MESPLLLALPAAFLVSGCLFGGGEAYSLTASINAPIHAVAAFPERVGGTPAPDEQVTLFIPFTTDAEASDTAYQDHKRPEAILPFVSGFCITAINRYHARYRIVDSENRIAFQGRAEFGFAGELRNLQRVVPKGFQGCLEWDLTATDSLYSPDLRKPGLYRWQVAFAFDDPKQNFVAERAFVIYQWPY